MNVRPASPKATPQVHGLRQPQDGIDRFRTALVVACMIYILLLGWGVLYRAVPFQSAYLLMTLPCLAPLAWYGYGFFRVSKAGQDFGLLLSAMGWGFVAITLIIKHIALNNDLSARLTGTMIESPGQSSAAAVCLGIGIFCLLLGAGVSAQAWMKAARRGEIE